MVHTSDTAPHRRPADAKNRFLAPDETSTCTDALIAPDPCSFSLPWPAAPCRFGASAPRREHVDLPSDRTFSARAKAEMGAWQGSGDCRCDRAACTRENGGGCMPMRTRAHLVGCVHWILSRDVEETRPSRAHKLDEHCSKLLLSHL